MTQEKLDLSKPPEPQEVEDKEDTQPEEEIKTVDQALKAFPGAPKNDQLEAWKQTYGEILCSGFSETELFVFRPVRREEWINLQGYVQQQGLNQFQVEEQVAQQCVLWASEQGQRSLENKAGSLSTLYEQILQVSNFMGPAMAASYVARL